MSETSGQNAFEVIKQSGIFNTEAKVADLFSAATALQREQAKSGGAEADAVNPHHVDTFIHAHFIYTHQD